MVGKNEICKKHQTTEVSR